MGGVLLCLFFFSKVGLLVHPFQPQAGYTHKHLLSLIGFLWKDSEAYYYPFRRGLLVRFSTYVAFLRWGQNVNIYICLLCWPSTSIYSWVGTQAGFCFFLFFWPGSYEGGWISQVAYYRLNSSHLAGMISISSDLIFDREFSVFNLIWFCFDPT